MTPQEIPFANTTPADYPIAEAFGYQSNGNNFPGLLTLTFLQSTSLAGFSIGNQASLLSLFYPHLTAVTGVAQATFNAFSNAVLSTISAPKLATVSNAASLNVNPALTTVDLPLLRSTGGNLTFASDTSLVSISLPSLVSVAINAGFFSFASCTALQNVSFPNYLPVNGRAQTFTACALTQSSVDHVLARAVANLAYVSGTINLSGGTSSIPGVQGQLDKATLIARGVIVITN